MTREELGFELMRIWDADKKTVIFVTHNITEAILLADRVVAMSPRPGRIAKIVDVALSRPRTIDMEFSAQFKSYSDQIRAVIYRSEGASKR
jgi:NitT/TauT family transport system ATP-binding protein